MFETPHDPLEIKAIAFALQRGRRLHPGNAGMLDALRKEVCELEHAYRHLSREEIKAEAMDVAVVALRISFEGDIGPNEESVNAMLENEIELLKKELDHANRSL